MTDSYLPANPKSEPEADQSFLHRKHLIGTAWAVIGGLVVGVPFALYTALQGPQRVIVANPDTTLRVLVTRDSVASDYLHQLLQEVHQLRAQAATAFSPPPQVGSAATLQDPGGSAGTAESLTNDPAEPPYRFPKRPEGAALVDISQVAEAACPNAPLPAGGTALLEFRLTAQSGPSAFTPVFLTVQRRESPTRVTSYFGQQFLLRKQNRIPFPVPREPGGYEFEYGFYRLSDSLATYPRFYYVRCPVTVR